MLLREKSHQDTPSPEKTGTEVSHMVGRHGYVVSVWNSLFRALGRVLLNVGWGACFIFF